MGLPLFKTPPDNGISPRPGDKDALNGRSSIRRQRTIRRRLDIPSRAALIQARLMGQEGRLPSSEEPSQESQDAEDAEATEQGLIARFIEDRRRRALMDGAPVAIPSPWADRSTPPLPRLTRDDLAPRVQPSDPWDWNPQPDGPLMPPAPESSDFGTLQMGAGPMSDRRAVLQRLYEERAQTRRLARNPTSSQGLTAPAQNESSGRGWAQARLPWPNTSLGYELRNADLGTSILSLVENNPARTRRLRVPRLDGLGDRDRSMSPEGDGAWDTLLTTISPDPQPPSAGSSFASTSAAAAASSSSNPRSSATSMATTMDGADDTTFENVCEYVETHSPASETDEEDVDLYELDDARSAGDRFWRGYADVVAARADRVARHAGQTDGDNLGGMQRIVRRLARREDIPDEWWAEAGLSRTLPRELVR